MTIHHFPEIESRAVGDYLSLGRLSLVICVVESTRGGGSGERSQNPVTNTRATMAAATMMGWRYLLRVLRCSTPETATAADLLDSASRFSRLRSVRRSDACW